MAVNKLFLEPDGLVVGATQLVASGGGVTIGQNLVVGGNLHITGYILGNGSQLLGVSTSGGGTTYSNANVASYLTTYTGNITAGNLIISTGSGQFNGPFNENTTVAGVYAGNLNQTPRVGFFNGNSTQNWQIDNSNGTFRWYTPGVSRMTLDPTGNLAVTSYANISFTGSADSALQIVGNVSRGGSGVHDFLRVTSTASGATNPNKYFRLDGTGNLQIINSTYGATILNLSDGGNLSDFKGDVRASPINSQPGSYIALPTDAGKTIVASLPNTNITFNASVFASGDMVSVVNTSNSTISIVQGTAVTLRLAGTATTGTRTLASNGLATLICTVGGSAPIFFCSGAGLT